MLLGLSASKLPKVPQSGSLAKAPPSTRTVTYDYESSSALSLKLQGFKEAVSPPVNEDWRMGFRAMGRMYSAPRSEHPGDPFPSEEEDSRQYLTQRPSQVH